MKRLISAIFTLKDVPRIGWVQRGVPLNIAENVAAHTLLVITFALLIAEEVAKKREIDKEKVMIIALLHDIEESEMNDIPKFLKSKLNYGEARREILEKIFEDLPKDLADKYLRYLLEDSMEKQIVEAADTLAMLYVARVYKKNYPDVEEIERFALKRIEIFSEDIKRAIGKLFTTKHLKLL